MTVIFSSKCNNDYYDYYTDYLYWEYNGDCTSSDQTCNGDCPEDRTKCGDQCLISGSVQYYWECNGDCIDKDTACDGKCIEDRTKCGDECLKSEESYQYWECNGECIEKLNTNKLILSCINHITSCDETKSHQTQHCSYLNYCNLIQ